MSLYKKYLLVGAALFLLLSMPALFVERVRGKVMGLLSPALKIKSRIAAVNVKERERFEGENQLLRNEIIKLRALIEQKGQLALLEEQLRYVALTPKRYEEIHFLAELTHQAVPAKVIYRDPGSWSSSLWVNVGEETNTLLKRPIICKNSPVIVGHSLVGAVDYVGKKQSRIRLITDVSLKPAVRAARGFPQNMALLEHIDPLVRHLKGSNVFDNLEQKTLMSSLEEWRAKISNDVEGYYLAKGIVQGSGTPLWRSVSHTLRGVGFNYDVADEEGPARELETGEAIGQAGFPTQPIIRINDLLVTTGLDGVFPPGLRVARVSKIYPLREGAYTYEIEAIPVVKNMDALQTVFIIPPIGYEEEE